MKKQLLFLTILFSLVISNVFSQTVYITKTGKKYHIEDCRFLSKSSFPISLADAKARGYNPCSVCTPLSNNHSASPSIHESKSISNEKSLSTNQSTTSTSEKKVQCKATTKAGKQCSRMTNSSNGKCWQHGGGD